MSDILRLRQRDLEWRALEEELVALDAARARYLTANRAGTVLWSALATGATREQLLALVHERFDVDERTAERDLDAFLDALRAEGLLADEG